MKKIVFIIFVFIFFVSIEEVFAKSVCIIYYESDFKTEIVKRLEQKFLEQGVSTVKDKLKNINKYDPEDFDAVIILSGMAAFLPYPQATIYISKHKYRENIVYFCASYIPDAVYGFLDSNKIDALTSASKKENIEPTVNMIMEKTLPLLNK
jgi:hypothetical protein